LRFGKEFDAIGSQRGISSHVVAAPIGQPATGIEVAEQSVISEL
jgi:hypothetical protein